MSTRFERSVEFEPLDVRCVNSVDLLLSYLHAQNVLDNPVLAQQLQLFPHLLHAFIRIDGLQAFRRERTEGRIPVSIRLRR
jgi:hypothetical protein